MSNVIPEKALNFTVYADGGELLGIAEGTLPNVEFMSSEVKGAGIAGVVDSPGTGHINSMTCELTWRTRAKAWGQLMRPGTHILDLYSAEQEMDAGLGMLVTRTVQVFMKALTKSYEFGKLAVNETTDTKTVHEIYYLKLLIDNEEIVEIDKYNFIYKVRGYDYMRSVRRALGK